MANGKYRDRVDLRLDTSAAGDEQPTYTPVMSLPCNIIHTSGDETYRGRQLEGRTDYIVEVPFDEQIKIDPTSILVVIESSGFVGGEVLNVNHVQIKRAPGRAFEFWVYCRERTT